MQVNTVDYWDQITGLLDPETVQYVRHLKLALLSGGSPFCRKWASIWLAEIHHQKTAVSKSSGKPVELAVS